MKGYTKQRKYTNAKEYRKILEPDLLKTGDAYLLRKDASKKTIYRDTKQKYLLVCKAFLVNTKLKKL
jgi:hypothetical protein